MLWQNRRYFQYNGVMIKLIALDLDGTIVNPSLKISDRVMRVLRSVLADTDIRLVIATGRMFPSAISFAQEIGVTEPIITYQGAMMRNTDAENTMRYHKPIPMKTAKALLEMLLEEKYHINLYVNDVLWTSPDNQFASFYAKTAKITPRFSKNLMGCLTDAPTKIMVIDDTRVDTLLAQLKKQFSTELAFCRSRTNFCEIIDVSVSKWNAIMLLATEYGIEPEEILAIGDQGNDLSMIEGAGIGVAMGNAPDEVKKRANFVTETIDNDGVALAIEKFALSHIVKS